MRLVGADRQPAASGRAPSPAASRGLAARFAAPASRAAPAVLVAGSAARPRASPASVALIASVGSPGMGSPFTG